MFISGHWAAAFINSLEGNGGETEDGLNCLKIIAAWVKALPGVVSGSSDAEKAEVFLREAMLKTGTLNPSTEIVLRFVLVMIKKNKTGYVDSVVDEVKKALDKKAGIVSVFVESAFSEGDDFYSRIKEVVKNKTGAARVELEKRVNPELIGGYRLRIGDEVIDSSVRSQLAVLENSLAAGNFDADGGN